MVQRLTLALVLMCIVVMWGALPAFVAIPSRDLALFLTLNVNGGPCSDCPQEARISRFLITVRNRTPWPIFVRDAKFDLIGVEWMGPRCALEFMIVPFGTCSCKVAVVSLDWNRPAEDIDAELAGEAAMPYITDSDLRIRSQ